jgi:hypothetical protein
MSDNSESNKTLFKPEIYTYFFSDILNYILTNKDVSGSSVDSWIRFIQEKDLGIIPISFHQYNITDGKKWALTKIKYAF